MEGRPELDIAFNSHLVPQTIVYCDSYTSLEDLSTFSAKGDGKLLKLSRALFDDLAYQHVPGNFMAVFESRNYSLNDLSGNAPLVVLESVEKPGNLGAILRTCDALGIQELIVTETAMDLYNPNVLRNSRGAAFTVKTVFCSNEEALSYIKAHHILPMAAALTLGAKDYRELSSGKHAYVFGPESTGLSDFWLENASEHLVIPMRGVVDSLNVSVSAAILLSHFTSARS